MTDDKRDDTPLNLSRRVTIKGATAALGVTAVAACGDDGGDDGAGTGDATGSTGADGTGAATSASGSGAADSSGGDGGSESEGSTGDAPEPLRTCEAPGDASVEALLANVDTIVVLMMENRSFDHYFGALALEEGLPVDGLVGDESNSDAMGRAVNVFPSNDWVVEEDPPHGWDASHAQWNNGANDGFVTTHLASGATDPQPVMGYHTREQLPVLYALADNYVLCDQWYASVLGPTWPNRFYLHLATSGGQTENEAVMDLPSVWDRLDDQGISNTYYHSTLAFSITFGKLDGLKHVNEFFEDAEAGNLPAVSYIDPAFSFEPNVGNDDHPPADIREGQAFIASIYNALANSSHWERSLLIITYDEHGGFYDHVAPPNDATDERPEFRQLGFRVPSIIVGPHVRRGCVWSTRLDHVSVISTITRKFGLEPLNERVSATNDVAGAIDPALIDAPRPPTTLPALKMQRRATYQSDVKFGGQTELSRYMDRVSAPVQLDRRTDHDAIMNQLFDRGVALGAIDETD